MAVEAEIQQLALVMDGRVFFTSPEGAVSVLLCSRCFNFFLYYFKPVLEPKAPFKWYYS